MSEWIAVALDGPAGAGKSSVAKEVARRLSLRYVDTGAIYRALALAVREAGVTAEDRDGVLSALSRIQLEITYDEALVQRTLLAGRDVAGEIRTPEISRMTSQISALPEVRAFLMEMQRDVARRCDVIMDGRDIGTVVLPEAPVKIFLTASPETRARRRWLELRETGQAPPPEEVLREIRERDDRDSARSVAPLKAAPDAFVLDTSDLTFSESVAAVCREIRRKTGRTEPAPGAPAAEPPARAEGNGDG